MPKTEWTVDDSTCYKNCDHIDKLPKHKIILSSDMWNVIRAMCHRYPSDEWQMLLTGKVENDECYCNGYYIPKQEVGSATVEHKDIITMDMIRDMGIVAGIHSHVQMAVSPSSTDIDDSIMSPIIYHLIVNNRYEIAGYRKATLPCGGFITGKSDVYIEGLLELDKVPIQGLENITKKTYTHTLYEGGGVVHGGYDHSREYDHVSRFDRERMDNYREDMLGWSE